MSQDKRGNDLKSEIERLKTAQKALRDSENRFRAAATSTADLIWEGDIRLNSLHWFGDVDAILGYELGEFPRTIEGHFEHIHDEDKEELSRNIQAAIQSGTQFKEEYRIRRKDGTYSHWMETGKAIEFEQGKAVRWVGAVTDITESKRAEKILYESEKRFRDISENAGEWIWEIDRHGKYTYSSPVVEKILGYRSEEVLGKYYYDLFHQDMREELKSAAVSVFRKKDPFHKFINKNTHKNGHTVWLSTSGVPLLNDQGELAGYRGVDTDVTEVYKAEQILRESEGKYKALSKEFNALLDAIPDSLVLLSPDLEILWANKAFATKHHKKASSLNGKHCYKLCCKISSPCKSCPVIATFKTGEEESTRVLSTDGKIFDKRAFPIRDESGNVTNVIEVARDITARVRMEEESKLVQTRLIHANKMTSLGTMVAGVAHEINNPNTFILNNAQLVNEIWEDAVKILSEKHRTDKNLSLANIPFPELNKVVPKLLFGIHDGALRIKNIVENLRNFSRPDKARLDGIVDVNNVVMTATSMLGNQIKKSTINYRIKCAEAVPSVKGSPQQIEQVIINLIMNALQSLPDKESGVWVYTSHNLKTQSVQIRVKDEGGGISGEILERVTEPFFTTKISEGGTGLGLSISYAIVMEHGGTLTIKSTEGKGTTATVRLPLSTEGR